MLGRQPVIDGLEPLGVLDNAQLLRIWCDDTARAIFPDRKIGRLSVGYEASFLVLEGNPIDDLANVQRITARVKSGRTLEMPPSE